MIYFNRPALVGNELKYIQDAVAQGMLCGDGKYTKLCSAWMKERFQVNQVFLTTSCTHALEMAAFLSDIQPGDEVIMPSYTFVSTADAFVLRGAKIVFVDIRPDTMNIDENLIEDAITEKTSWKSVIRSTGNVIRFMMDIMRDWKIWKNRERFRDRSFRRDVYTMHICITLR